LIRKLNAAAIASTVNQQTLNSGTAPQAIITILTGKLKYAFHPEPWSYIDKMYVRIKIKELLTYNEKGNSECPAATEINLFIGLERIYVIIRCQMVLDILQCKSIVLSHFQLNSVAPGKMKF